VEQTLRILESAAKRCVKTDLEESDEEVVEYIRDL
jgi:hypothetical protein